MANPTRIEIDCSTGIESIIELTDAEVATAVIVATLGWVLGGTVLYIKHPRNAQ